MKRSSESSPFAASVASAFDCAASVCVARFFVAMTCACSASGSSGDFGSSFMKRSYTVSASSQWPALRCACAMLNNSAGSDFFW